MNFYGVKVCLFHVFNLRYATRGQIMPVSVETYIHHMLYNIPLPICGHSTSIPGVLGTDFLITIPHTSELPLFEYSLYDLIQLIPIPSLLTLLTAVLLENQVFLYSSRKYRVKLCNFK